MIGLFLCLLAAGGDADVRFFDRRVAPILTKRCLGCHNNELKAANVSFLDRGSLTAVVGLGDPAASLLVRAIRRNGDIKMPPGPALPAKDIATLTEWVRWGAPLSRRWPGRH